MFHQAMFQQHAAHNIFHAHHASALLQQSKDILCRTNSSTNAALPSQGEPHGRAQTGPDFLGALPLACVELPTSGYSGKDYSTLTCSDQAQEVGGGATGAQQLQLQRLQSAAEAPLHVTGHVVAPAATLQLASQDWTQPGPQPHPVPCVAGQVVAPPAHALALRVPPQCVPELAGTQAAWPHHQHQPVEPLQVQQQERMHPAQARAEAEARVLLAEALCTTGNVDLAILHYQMAMWMQPYMPAPYLGLGACFAKKGDAASAHRFYGEALQLQPACAIGWRGMGLLYAAGAEHKMALLCFQEALVHAPNCLESLGGMAQALKGLHRRDDAAQCYLAMLQLNPRCARTHAALAGLRMEMGQLDAAVACYKEALHLDPGFAAVYNDLGNALRGLGRYSEAVDCYAACLQLHYQTVPSRTNMQHLLFTTAVTYNNLASVLKLQNRHDQAVACYEHVTRLQPESADGFGNLGNAYKDSAQQEQAIAAYQRALTLRPDYPAALANLVHSLQCVCDWRERDAVFARLKLDIARQLAQGMPSAVQPFHAMAYPLDAGLVLQLTMMHARHVQMSADALGVGPLIHPPRAPLGGRRLRVGYCSSDIGNHPLSHLMGSVWGMHDRERLEIFVFALSPPDGSPWRQRAERETEHFMDVSALSVPQLAHQIQALGIQILVDLNGYTKGARMELFALRPAPIQVSYMGFPATTGASFIDYLVTDRVVAPPHLKHCYSENLVYMPNCYFVNDYKQSHKEVLDEASLPTRAEFGLPEDKLVFSCSNQLYKFDPETMETWCNILRRVPDSVLWLLRFPPFGEPRVKKEAAARGVAPERIIFTDVAPKEVHVRRSGLADVFLDTPLCNAHTTGCDTLWAGCPVVTLPLERMASRVCASLCTAAGFGPQMVVNSQKEYEERAVALGTNPEMLANLRRDLREARTSCELFNTRGWVEDFDRVFLTMWDIYVQEGAPRDFEIPPRTSQTASSIRSASNSTF
mmetsp:Transcript_31787/g.59752  ORF Transcript_31787/g.59752 Transcript_31787/m.59752 type:complete len:980 (-) Transcript_31787:480-3419(-)